MADIFQGTVAPDVNTTRTTGTTAPQYYTDYLSGLAGAGTTALNRPAGELVAPMTALQQQGYAAIPGAATAYQPGLTAAQQTVSGVAQGLTPEKIQSLMNPYTTGVVNEMERLQQQNIQRNLMPQLKAGFVGSGGLGSQRYANALGQTAADWQSNLLGAQTGALQQGYNQALQAAINEGQLQNQAGQIQGNLAGQQQTLGLAGAGAMTKGGAEQQAFEQAKINAPLTQATNVANLMKGYNVPSSTTETYKGPLPGAYGLSPLSQITGLGSLVASGLGETTTQVWNPATKTYETKTTPNALQKYWDLFSKNFGGSFPTVDGADGTIITGDGIDGADGTSFPTDDGADGIFAG
jgi:hypothetical protein